MACCCAVSLIPIMELFYLEPGVPKVVSDGVFISLFLEQVCNGCLLKGNC